MDIENNMARQEAKRPRREAVITVRGRSLVIPPQLSSVAVENDRDSVVIPILCPRRIQGRELSGYSFFLRTLNAKGGYDALPLLMEEQGERLRLQWVLRPPQTSYSGKLLIQLWITGEGFDWQTAAAPVNMIRQLGGEPAIPSAPAMLDSFLKKFQQLEVSVQASERSAASSASCAADFACAAGESAAEAGDSQTAAAGSAAAAAGSAFSAQESAGRAEQHALPVRDAAVDADGRLTLTLGDGSTVDAGKVAGPPGPGLPASGSSGQLLAKAGPADYAAEWIDAGELALQPPKSYAGPSPIPLITRSTDKIYVDFEGDTALSGTPSPDSPATLSGTPFSAAAAGPDGQSRSVSLGITGYSLPDGVKDTYTGKTGELVQRIGKLVLDGTESLVKHTSIPNCFGLEQLLTNSAIPFSALCTHFTATASIATVNGFTITVGRRLYFRSASFAGGSIDSVKSWLAAQAAAGTPVTILYALSEPIAYNRKADIPAFEGATTVTGAAAAGVIDDRVLRLNGLMPFELLQVNPNLLDNGYFLDPINQRGKTEYTAGYTIDRWQLNSKTMTVENNGIKWEAGSVLLQPFERDISQGQSMTVSYMDASGAVYGMIVPTNSYKQIGDFSFLYRDNTLYILSKNSNAIMRAVKLELGTEQTLARKAGDQWVLNDPLPNRALELAKCQRYYYQSWKGPEMAASGFMTCLAASEFRLDSFNFPVSMRANPSIKFYSASSASLGQEGVTNWNGDILIPDVYSVYGTSDRTCVGIPTTNGKKFTVGQVYLFHYSASAEL